MDNEINNQILVDLTRSDYMLLKHNNKDQYASLQGKMVDYGTWCKIMNCLDKLKNHNKYESRTNFAAERVAGLD